MHKIFISRLYYYCPTKEIHAIASEYLGTRYTHIVNICSNLAGVISVCHRLKLGLTKGLVIHNEIETEQLSLY